MTTNADIISKLRADVAAASGPAPKRLGRGALAELNRWNAARARLAAIDGPALLAVLIEEHAALEAISGPCDGPDECGVCDTIADCADALEVSDA